MKNQKLLTIPLLAATLLILPACNSRPAAARIPQGQRPPAQAPAMIGHIIFLDLTNPADYHDILHDADWMLATIPTVATYAAGKHLDTGSPAVTTNYDLAIYLGFNSEQNLRTFLVDDQHIRFIKKWNPRLNALTIYDMIDWPTTRYNFIN